MLKIEEGKNSWVKIFFPPHAGAGWILPLVMIGFLVLMFIYPQIPGENKSGVLFYSLKGPGFMHAPLLISLVVGLGIGFLAQGSRFCTMGALRDLILFGQAHLLSGFLALVVFALAGGCPGRQLFLAGEGDTDAAVFVMGMIVGAGFAHNFGLANSPKGVGPHGIAAVIVGFAVCLFIGFAMRKKGVA